MIIDMIESSPEENDTVFLLSIQVSGVYLRLGAQKDNARGVPHVRCSGLYTAGAPRMWHWMLLGRRSKTPTSRHSFIMITSLLLGGLDTNPMHTTTSTATDRWSIECSRTHSPGASYSLIEYIENEHCEIDAIPDPVRQGIYILIQIGRKWVARTFH